MHFLFPAFLFLLIAALVPIIIHLLKLRRHRQIIFTNNSFIQDAVLKASRYRNVKHLLILLMRVISVSALVFIFSQPFIPALQKENVEAHEVGILLDNSPSMQATGAYGSLIDQASSQVREMIKEYGRDKSINWLGKTNRIMYKLTLEEELNKSGMSPNGNNLFSINDLFTSPLPKIPTYIFSDFQKSQFDGNILTRLDVNQTLVLVPQVKNKVGNIYVDSVWIDDEVVRLRTDINLHVRLRNGGEVQVDDCPVKVLLGSRQVAAYRVTVGPGAVVTNVLQIQISDNNAILGRLIIDDATVKFDNAYYFALKPAELIQVVEIGEVAIGQRAYINESLFNYQFFRSQNVNYGALGQANMLLLGSVTQIEFGLRQGIRALLKRGGSVVVVPPVGERSRPAYEQLFKELGLGTPQWEALKNAVPEKREVGVPSTQAPFFRNVFGVQQRAVTMPRVVPVLRWSRTGQDILRLRDGESYLAEFASGAGRVYVFSAPFEPAYSDFAEHALFVPVMYRMAMLSYRSDQRQAYRLDERTVAFTIPGMSGVTNAGGNRSDAAGFRLVKDSLTFIPAQWVQGNEVRLEIPSEMTAPGFYQVQRGGKTLTTLAFNGNKRESELAAYSAAELRALIGPNRPNVQVVEAGPKGEGLAALQAGQTGRPLWRYFLGLVLVALLAEALLVRFRTGGKTAMKARATA